ncbi:MAG: TIGR03067 domain-containing protein [Novipirellula sp. JB048]
MLSRIIATAVALCVFSAPTALVSSAATPQEVLKKLAGTWEIDEGVNQGEEVSEEDLEGTTVVITDKTIVTYDKDQKETYRATFTLDTSKRPIQIDMTAKIKEGASKQALGILEFDDDDEFTICYALPGAERPTKFKSPPGSKIMLFECERDD